MRIVIVGGGIVGTALAAEVSSHGNEVVLISDSGVGGGATAAGMGHLVALDEPDPKSPKAALTELSLDLWASLELPEDCERENCGTLWVAESAADLDRAAEMQARYRTRGIDCELIEGKSIYELEPELADGLRGGLDVPNDSVIYPPNAAQTFWRLAALRGAVRRAARAIRVEPGRVELIDGSVIEGDWVVVAAGDRTAELLPELPIHPRKGHLLITARHSRLISRQIVELGYGASTRSKDRVSIACNVQPRPSGQLLIGSSRQENNRSPDVEFDVLEGVLERAAQFIPRLPRLTALRAWVGFRAAVPDNQPIIGTLEQGLAVASGHEGLGITQAPGTARLMAHVLEGSPPAIDISAFDPRRFDRSPAEQHHGP